jgi:hypothetical protein
MSRDRCGSHGALFGFQLSGCRVAAGLGSMLVLGLRGSWWPGSARAETDSRLDNVPACHFVGPLPGQDQTLARAVLGD